MQVLVVSPPNSNTVIDGASCTVTRPEEHTDWSDFPNLGILTLVSALRDEYRRTELYARYWGKPKPGAKPAARNRKPRKPRKPPARG